MMKLVTLIAFSIISLLFFSCEEILLEDNISKEKIVIIAPQNNAQFNSTSITFTWEPIQYAKNYRLQIAKPNFTTPSQIVLDTEITATTHTMQLPVGIYEWRVKAISGNTSTTYQTRTISILNNQNFQDNSIVLTSPTNNLITKNTIQNLSWQSIIGATNYQLQIYNNSTIISDQTISNTTTNYTFPEGNYNWRVRATNGSDFTLYASRTILIDTTPPNTAILSSPANSSTTSNTNISFQWSRTSIAGSSEYDNIYIYKDSNLSNLYSENQSSSPFTTTLPTGTYFWYVKTFDAAGNESIRSNVFSITIN